VIVALLCPDLRKVMGGVCPSVRLSVACLDRQSRTEKFRKPKICRTEAWVTHETILEVNRSKVKVTGSQSVKALLLADSTRYVRVYMRREDIGTATLNSHTVSTWLFLYTPSYRMIVRMFSGRSDVR